MAKKMFAILHDGTTDGDNLFYCPGSSYPYKEGMILKDIKDMLREDAKKDPDGAYSLACDQIKELKGAWIVDKKGFDICTAVWNSDPCGDSETYCCNRAAKCVAEAVCLKKLKTKEGPSKVTKKK